MSNAICALGSCSVNAVAGDRIFIGQSTIGTSLFELETPYADPHVRCCERCDAKHPPTRFVSTKSRSSSSGTLTALRAPGRANRRASNFEK